MKLSELKSLNDASDADMLRNIFAAQLHIIRRIDQLEIDITGRNKSETNFERSLEEMIERTEDFREAIEVRIKNGLV